jgi:tRNA (cytidine/uridine-2'-O-)-methyltransferase
LGTPRVTEYTDVNEWMNQVSDRSRVLMSSHAEKSYLDIEFQDGDWLVFGKEESVLEPRSWIYLPRKINSKSPCHL